MNQHLGATYSLSVLIVVSFAVALYRADPPPSPTKAEAPRRPGREVASGLRPAVDRDRAVARSPAGTAAPARTARAEPRAPTAVAPARPAVVAEVGTAPGPDPTAASAPVARQVSRTARSAARPARRGGVTIVEPGETLAGVAARVYGPGGSVEGLWRANRDQVATADGPLRAGMLLRTP